jgi:hypothetical protein
MAGPHIPDAAFTVQIRHWCRIESSAALFLNLEMCRTWSPSATQLFLLATPFRVSLWSLMALVLLDFFYTPHGQATDNP